MGGQSTLSTSETRIDALQLQSSAYGVTIPILGGVNRIAGNLLYYNDFKSTPHTTSQSSGKGGGGGVTSTNTSYTYSASMIMSLCHGRIAGVPRIWKGSKLFADGTGQFYQGTTEGYVVAAGGGSFTVSQAAKFASNYTVNCQLTTPDGTKLVTLAEGIDYSCINGVYSFPASLAGVTVYCRYTYCYAYATNSALTQIGASLMPGAISQAAPSWVTSLHPSDAIGYSGMGAVQAQNYALNGNASLDNHTFEVVSAGAYVLSPTIPDIDLAAFAVRVLGNSRYGARLPSQMIGSYLNWSNYVIANGLLASPSISTQMSAADFLKQCAVMTNTGLVWTSGQIQFIPYGDASATANGSTYTPNLTPVYDLTDDVFLTQGAEPPVKITRKASTDSFNNFRVQFSNRNNNYASEIAEASDQADIEQNGLRQADIFNADWVCDGNVARNIAQMMVQRSLYVRATYEFTLPWNFILMEAMDLATITDPYLGFNKLVVRIIEVNEKGGELTFTAEDFKQGIASTSLYLTQIGAGYLKNYNVSPGSVSAPAIFEAPVNFTTNGLEVYVATGGSNANYGGCNVWLSMDGTNYKQFATVNGAARFGTCAADTGTTLGVSGLLNPLNSGSAADASALTTLCYADTPTPEYFAYTTATLTGAGAYTLGGLNRAAYQTPQSAHNSGKFVRVDASIAKSGALDWSLIGKTIHIKMTAFNIYGAAEESLANVTDYTYTITGNMLKLPPNPPTSFVANNEPFGIRLSCVKSPDPDVTLYEYRIGATWATAAVIANNGGTSYLWAIQNSGTYLAWVAAVDAFGNYSTPVSVSASIGSGAITGFNSSLAGRQLTLTWNAITGSFANSGYEVRYGSTWASATSLGFYTLNSYTETVQWAGSRQYWVAAIDVAGNYSTPVSLTFTVTIPSAPVGVYANVIDNDVLLYWTGGSISGTQLPVSAYEVRKGATWATATLVGSNGNSTFAGVFEQVSGVFTYWIAAIDSAGTYGTPVSLAVTVNQPPDFVFRNNYNSVLGGTLVNAYTERGAILLPADTSKTFAAHFSTPGWATPNDQITAGYPIYANPSLATASYEEIIDYGATVSTSTVTATLGYSIITGSVLPVCTISWKLNSGDAWTVLSGGQIALIPANFRYIRIHYDFSSTAGANLIKINSLNIRLSIKLRNDSGSGVSAIGGTALTFGYPFIYADNPIAQANGLDAFSKPYFVAVIYTNSPNPTGFTVRIYNSAGTEVSGVTFSWTARGY